MPIDLRNIPNKDLSSRDNIAANPLPKPISNQNSTQQEPKTKPAQFQSQANLATTKLKIQPLSVAQLILVVYLGLFLFGLGLSIRPDWTSIWQLPKLIIFIWGVFGLLLISSLLWIFGFIKQIVKLNLGDIFILGFGLAMLVISLLNPNRIAFWGSTTRMFDAGLFISFLVLFYLLLKLFLIKKAVDKLEFGLGLIILVSNLISVCSLYIPNFNSLLVVLSSLQPISSWISESSEELVLLNLLAVNIIFTILLRVRLRSASGFSLVLLYSVSVLIHLLLLIRLPNLSLYLLTLSLLIMHSLIVVTNLSKQAIRESRQKLFISRISFIYGILAIFLVTMIFIRPFQNNLTWPELPQLTTPTLETSLSILQQTLRAQAWLGSGNIMYAWNKFAPQVSQSQVTDFSFETLHSEVLNIWVRNGLVVGSLFSLVLGWHLIAIFRLIFIQRSVPVQAYSVILLIAGLFLMPFSVFSKLCLILVLVIWSNFFSQYFLPLLKLDLDITRIPASILSLSTFILLLAMAISALAAGKIFNLAESQVYLSQALQTTDKPTEQVQLLAKARSKSPAMIDYTDLYLLRFIDQINQQAIDLANSSRNGSQIDADKQQTIQQNIILAQELIDQYARQFPDETRVVYWQLKLYYLVHQYGEVEEEKYLSLIDKARALQPNSLYWDIYKAQYYSTRAQKTPELNLDQFNQAKSILREVLNKDPYFVEAYKNYYDLLGLRQAYSEQVSLLDEYVQAVLPQGLIADQELVYRLALAYQNNKQYSEALLVYNKLLEVFPNYTNVYFQIGKIYEAKKEIPLAIQQYQKVLELDPQAEEARLKLEQLR